MSEPRKRLRLPHRHRALSIHVVVQRDGVPYELERIVCEDCERVLSERPLKRTAA
ncbi:MAG TPA: hypothetical protein VJ986_09755 [Gaiellaceae bacterium]|nr:hypothetical protein [Gaiellaceae bacterium]